MGKFSRDILYILYQHFSTYNTRTTIMIRRKFKGGTQRKINIYHKIKYYYVINWSQILTFLREQNNTNYLIKMLNVPIFNNLI